MVVNFDDVNLIPSRIEAEDFVIDPSFTGSTIEARIILGAGLPCVFPIGDDGGPGGGFDIDIDIDHYRNGVLPGAEVVESGALPNTL